MKETARNVIKNITADPQKLIAEYKKAYRGITDNEAHGLALAFIGLWNGSAGREARQREYARALAEVERKYSGGDLSEIELETFDYDLPLLNIDIDLDMPLLDVE